MSNFLIAFGAIIMFLGAGICVALTIILLCKNKKAMPFIIGIFGSMIVGGILLGMLHYSSLDAIPIMVFVLMTCIMSYWHGRSEYGWRIAGLVYTIILGIIGQILVGFFPMFG